MRRRKDRDGRDGTPPPKYICGYVLSRSDYYQLRQLRPLTRSLSSAAAETVVHAFIASRLDYCNALLYGVSDRLMCRLPSVQNAAARLVTGARRCDHITPILRQLHWLPVRQRVLFKIAVLVFQCLAGEHRRTCQTIASLSLTPDRVVSGRVSFDVHTTRMVSGALPLQGRRSGTLCRLNCNNVALSDNLNGV